MPERWLQIRGDPSVRRFLFSQQRVESLFDQQIDRVHAVMLALLTRKGVFHVKVHYSSSQLTCWFCDDAYRYRVYVREEVLDDGFLDHFRDLSVEHLKPLLHAEDISPMLDEFRRLRLSDETVYLRNASVNLVNGMIGMTFSCDGAHYIDYKAFLAALDAFATPPSDSPAGSS